MEDSREIRFRAWDKKDKKMYDEWADEFDYNHGTAVGPANDGGYLAIEELLSTDEENEPERYVLMQYTGLKDKNGVEIYEGDIVDITSTNTSGSILPSKYKVIYGCGSFDISRESYGETISYRIGEIPNGNNEILGNIYENPELLGRGEDE